MYYESNNTLQHHGILGQKWGVRRFQNKDGSLTGEGKKRYKVDAEKVRTSTNQIDQNVGTLSRVASNHNPNRKTQAEKASAMSNEELQKVINRKNLERQYIDLTSEQTTVERGANYTREILQTTGAVLGIALAIKTLSGK